MSLHCEISDRVRLTCVAVLFACSQASLAADSITGASEYEKQAIKIANDFITAAEMAHDPVKAASYMADDVEVRINVSKPAVKGRDTAIELLKGMMGNNPNRPPGPKRIKQKIETASALGGADAVMVIQRRIDDFEINGKVVSYPVGAMYRIRVKDWKIEEWVDLPLTMPNFGPPREGPPPQPAGDPSTR